MKIAFDEWNLRGWHHPGFPRKAASDESEAAVAQFIQARQKNAIASQYTMADALFSASFLNACELSFQSGYCELPPHSVTVVEVQ